MYYTWHAVGMMTAQRWNKHKRQASERQSQARYRGTAASTSRPRYPLQSSEGSTQSTYKYGVREAVRATSTAAQMRDAEGFLGDAASSMRLADRAEQELERICAAAGLNPPCDPDPAALSSDRVQRDGG